jgi:UDP-N-acetylglucosamine diphosphorylase / glucose-1-phosphate thymidylyltransferase / UDP-N-acetylgalactosamine diphosphorylase / glucosamine-1-phosphate N-acetyltransferase / galactosamine-1-phosphate N-acetyltransferase
MSLTPDHFFDLADFQHRALFDQVGYVWEVLGKIGDYLKGIPLGKIEVEIPEGAYLINREQISIGKGTLVEPGAYIQGPCIIGQNCTVRHGAYIRGDLIAGDGCVIGHDTEVKNAIFLNQAHAAHFAYVGDSVLGNRVNLGAGTKCANLKLDNGPVVIHFEGQRIVTGRRKFGAILGDGTQIGCNAVMNPGTLCGQEVRALPCTNFGGYIPAKHLVKLDAKIAITRY